MRSELPYDAIIIGAGMSGLAAGIRLAMYEKRVCLLERHYAIGGLNSYYRLGGRNYDVGLHALTNFTPRGAKHGPLARLLRQLRFSWDDFELAEQNGSAIAFPGVRLKFTNDIAHLTAEISRDFPKQADNFHRLLSAILNYDELTSARAAASARQVLAEIITEPLLAEMLLCPVMFYGSAREHDMDFGQFSIMFRALYLEGFCRPRRGVRQILSQLVKRYKQLGGELRLRAGVQEIMSEVNRVSGVRLDDGTVLTAREVISSAGWNETMRLCGEATTSHRTEPGIVTYIESISHLNCQPRELGHDETIVFYSHNNQFSYANPAELADVSSGIICSPNNYAYHLPGEPAEGTLRITALANYDRWAELSPDEYAAAKAEWYDRMLAAALRVMPDVRPHIVDHDMFTPTTIRRFTGHDFGAVYGAPQKRYDATTHLANLTVCGGDQGYVGIVGAITSGIQVANRLLR